MANDLLARVRPVHPGEVLREDVLPALNMSKSKIARLLGTTRQSLYAILREERAVTKPMACQIGKLTDTSPEMWLNLQRAYGLQKSAAEGADGGGIRRGTSPPVSN